MTGQLSSAGSPFTVLIDSSDTHSFVSSKVIDRLCRPSEYRTAGFGTLLPTGELVVCRRWIRTLPVMINSGELSVDFIELDMEDFYMILGMD